LGIIKKGSIRDFTRANLKVFGADNFYDFINELATVISHRDIDN